MVKMRNPPFGGFFDSDMIYNKNMQSKLRMLLKKIVRWLDPKLETFREQKPPAEPALYLPETEEELVYILRNTPKEILPKDKRAMIASVMSFRDTTVKKLMLKKADMTFVNESETLGPLMLDKLYRSGFSHFPVLSKTGEVVGAINTSSLNSLKIRNDPIAKEILHPEVFYLREDYTLEQALNAFLRTNSFVFIIINQRKQIVGELTYQMMVEFLIGKRRHDDFEGDDDINEVAERRLR